MIRKMVHYTGRVQGVGFRATCKAISLAHDVAGTVKNLPDGRVELVAEGQADAVDAFLMSIDGKLGMFIHDRHAEESETTGGLEGFKIMH